MDAYASGRLGAQTLRLEDGDRIIAIGSINSPMQCMMKEICAQCLQPHKDPATAKVTWVFSCFNQDQPLDLVDFGTLNERLKQNSLAEKLTAQWIRHCMPELKKERSFV